MIYWYCWSINNYILKTRLLQIISTLPKALYKHVPIIKGGRQIQTTICGGSMWPIQRVTCLTCPRRGQIYDQWCVRYNLYDMRRYDAWLIWYALWQVQCNLYRPKNMYLIFSNLPEAWARVRLASPFPAWRCGFRPSSLCHPLLDKSNLL